MKRILFLWLLIAIGGSSCMNVKTLTSDEATFDEYRTFCWFEGCEFTIDGPDYLKNDAGAVEAFQKAIERELMAKGYQKDEDNPDFLVHMHVAVKEETAFLSTPLADLSGEKSLPSLQGDLAGQNYLFLKGSLIIDMADMATSKMIWHSDAVEYFDLTNEFDADVISKGVKKALRKFPKMTAE